MPKSRQFAYNTGSPIAGTQQVGNLAVGIPSSGFASTGLEWWSGPDEDLGYVIACQVPDDSQPTPITGASASVGFFRSPLKTEASFISLSEYFAGASGPFATGILAKEWLNTNGYWTSYSSFIVSSGKTTTGGYQVGDVIDKDMTGPSSISFTGSGVPGGSGITISADYWSDWGDDIFDSWGYFYLYDPAANNYLGLSFNTKNQANGVFSTQVFTFNGRTFTIIQGYPVQGIFKFEIRCSDDQPFVFGEGGNMGSDGSTANIDQSYAYTLDGTNLTLWYNENYQTNNPNERFYSYYVPFLIDDNATKTYTDFMQGSDNLYLYSVQCTNGLTVYHSKRYDVKQWVVYDLEFGE